jgi:hypothetical protein
MSKDMKSIFESYQQVQKNVIAESAKRGSTVLNEKKEVKPEDKKAEKKDNKKDPKKDKKKALKESLNIKLKELKALIAEAEEVFNQKIV